MAGPSPNPELDGESRVGEIIAILTVASVLSTVTVALRCYCRIFMLRSFGPDDALIVPAQILTLGSAIAIGLEAKYGLGRHIWVMPDEDLIPYMKSFYASIVVYNVAVCLTKISILLQYHRIFSNTILRKIIKFGLGFLICWGVTLCFLLPMVCMPVAAFWDPDVEGYCLDNETIWYIMAGVNVVTDFAVFTMPIPVISSLHLPKRQKAMLFFVFTIGVFPCAVSIYRIRTLHAAAKSADPTWDNVDAATFSFLELTVGVIAICLPTLRPILAAAMPAIFDSLRRSTGRSNTGPTGGASRTPFGGGGGATGRSSAARGSMMKGTLRESDSTEGLRPDDIYYGAPRSRMDNDIEFGELESPAQGLHSPGLPRRYSVSVVAGWEPAGLDQVKIDNEADRAAGIKTTTIVTQKVSFQGGSGRSSEEKVGKAV